MSTKRKGPKTLTVTCPVCCARPGELCAWPTRAQIDAGLLSGTRWTGRVRTRSHSSRVDKLERQEMLAEVAE